MTYVDTLGQQAKVAGLLKVFVKSQISKIPSAK